MDVPGEKLLIKMWESLADRGIGSLLKPWQMRRESRAQLETRRNEMLLLAQAEKEAEEIRAGKKKVVETDRKSLMLLSSDAEVIDGRAEPVLDMGALMHAAEESKRANAVREEINVAKTILQAEDILSADPSEATEHPIDADWLYRWRDCAAQVSSDELQSLWAKVLAGEVKSPGAHSLRTLDFLKNLSRAEAEQIQRLCPYVVNGQFIFTYGEMANSPTTSIDFLMQMQELGLISGVGGVGLTITWKPNGGGALFVQYLLMHNRAVVARTTDLTKVLTLTMYRVTPLGMQVLALSPMPASEPYVQAIAEAVKAQGFDAYTAVSVAVPGGRHILNEVKV
ncbi:DUF2806 domain-containing protein [Paraburkholderia fungorum]|uniref:DUF2806 domain-containing protein n=1 Tax=Paraburkholderia fungorum TaxID=134537 RepID=UPI0038BBC90D